MGRCERRTCFSPVGAGRSAVVSRRSRGGSCVATESAHDEPSVPVAASRRGGAYGDSTGSTLGGGAAAAATCSGVCGRDGRGGATTEASENAASVIPISRCLERLYRGNRMPKPMAAAMTTAGTPRITKSSEDPTGCCVTWRISGETVAMYTQQSRHSITKRANGSLVPGVAGHVKLEASLGEPQQLRLTFVRIRFRPSGKGL